jgi:DNA-binding protein HU-beta
LKKGKFNEKIINFFLSKAYPLLTYNFFWINMTLSLGGSSMNKQELVDIVAQKAKVTKKEAIATIDSTIEAVIAAVASGKKVTLVGFGTFSALLRKARKGRNPQTGKEIRIPERKSPKFSAGKLFKDKVK